jgi:hypothetical protein
MRIIIKGDEKSMKTKTMEITAEAISQRIENDYADIVRLYRSVPVTAVEEAGLPNGWSVKDVLAHIAAWDWRYASLLEAAHDTNAPLQAKPDIDALNRETYQERAGWGWEEVEYDFHAAHQSMIEAIRQFPAARLNDDFVQANIAEETWEHYAQHLPDLQRWHKRVTSN